MKITCPHWRRWGTRRPLDAGTLVGQEALIRRLHLKCDGTRAETIFRLSAKRTSPFKSAGASVQSTTGSRGMRISGTNAGYTMFRGSVKSTSYPLHSSVSPSLPLPCVTVCHHISTGLYLILKYVVRSFGLDSVLPTNGSSLTDMRVASLITTAPDLLSTPLDLVLFQCLGSEFSFVL
jgi:hypothetical protein